MYIYYYNTIYYTRCEYKIVSADLTSIDRVYKSFGIGSLRIRFFYRDNMNRYGSDNNYSNI